MKKREKTFFVCFKNWFGIVFTLIVLVSFSETTTPGFAGESKKNYIVKSPPGIIEVRSANCTNKIQGGLFRKISQACNTQHGDASIMWYLHRNIEEW